MNYHWVCTLLDSHTQTLSPSFTISLLDLFTWLTSEPTASTGGQIVKAKHACHTFQWVALPSKWAEREERREGECSPARVGSSGPWTLALHESQSSIISHPTQYRNTPAVKLFTYPHSDSRVGNKCKSMSREGEMWVNATGPDAAQADTTYPYDGLVQLANYSSLIVRYNVSL